MYNIKQAIKKNESFAFKRVAFTTVPCGKINSFGFAFGGGDDRSEKASICYQARNEITRALRHRLYKGYLLPGW